MENNILLLINLLTFLILTFFAGYYLIIFLYDKSFVTFSTEKIERIEFSSIIVNQNYFLLYLSKFLNYFAPLVTIMHSSLVSLDIIRIRWIRYTKMRFAGKQNHMIPSTDLLAIFIVAIGLGPINTGILI